MIRTKEKCKQGKGVGQAGDGGWHFSVKYGAQEDGCIADEPLVSGPTGVRG